MTNSSPPNTSRKGAIVACGAIIGIVLYGIVLACFAGLDGTIALTFGLMVGLLGGIKGKEISDLIVKKVNEG
jgi:hypothetical protein